MRPRNFSLKTKASPIAINFSTYARAAAADIEPVLRRRLGQWEAEVSAQSAGGLDELTGILAAAVGGGKLLRGALVKLGYELAAGAPPPGVLEAAAAYETLHTGFLVHDDIMDDSSLRRGRPSAHVLAGGGRYGTAQAICLADAAFFMAHRALADSGLEAARVVQAQADFSHIAQDTAAGQMLDMKYACPGAARTEADVLRIYALKTAAYTICGPLRVGGRLGGATDAQLQAFTDYGRHVGLAYQIQDDILGVFGSEEVVGKPVTSDISENKNTVLIVYAHSAATSPQRQTLDRLYGRADLSAEDIASIKEIFVDSGALDYARNLAQSEVAAAVAAAARVTTDPAQLYLLTDLAEYSVSRTS